MPTKDKAILKRNQSEYRQRRNISTMAVSTDNKAKLAEYRDKHGHPTLNEALAHLLTQAEA